jgi:glycosyltransferase involved in cell wall biosynthesis
MGLHREFMKAARAASIPIVYTSHDYYGICPHVNLFRQGAICAGASAKCIECCSGGLSMWRIRLMQSRPYRIAKDTWVVRKARMRYRHRPEAGNLSRRSPSVEDYLLLQEYYSSMFAMVDRFHFNSALAFETFTEHVVVGSHEVVPITHGGVNDNRSMSADDDGVVDLAYVGPFEDYKGFFVLIESLDALWQEGIQGFRLHLYGEPSLARPYFCRHARFRPSERHEALRGVELLVVPSLCPETFGFTLLEALCEGIPVVATSRVGSVEMMGPDQGVVVAPHMQALTTSLRELLSDSTQIRKMSERIVAEFQPKSIREHALEIRDLYRVAV